MLIDLSKHKGPVSTIMLKAKTMEEVFEVHELMKTDEYKELLKQETEHNKKRFRNELSFIAWALSQDLVPKLRRELQKLGRLLRKGIGASGILKRVHELEQYFMEKGEYRTLHIRSRR